MARSDEAFPAPIRVERDNYRSSSIFPRSDFMPAIGRSRSRSEMGHFRPDWAVRVMSGLPPGRDGWGGHPGSAASCQQQTWPSTTDMAFKCLCGPEVDDKFNLHRATSASDVA